MSATDWTTTDYQKVAAVLSAYTFVTKTTGWKGFFDPNTIPNPAPAPSSDLRNPTVFGTWDIAYTSVAATFDEDDPPVRDFVIVFAVWAQPGATRGHALDVFAQLRTAFKGADSDSVVFCPTTGVPQPLAQRDDWAVEVLPMQAMGGVAA